MRKPWATVTKRAGDPLTVSPPHALVLERVMGWEAKKRARVRERAKGRRHLPTPGPAQEPLAGILGDTGQLPALREPLRALV